MRFLYSSRWALVVALSVLWALIPEAILAQDRITCNSKHYRYNYCRANTDNRVRLVRQHSRAACIQGRTWGYDRRGVWVDNGCAAEFEIRRRGGSSGITPGLSGHGGGHHKIPSWAIGTFRGYNPRYDARVKLRIHASGKVIGKAEGVKLHGHFNARRQEIEFGGQRFKVHRERGGLRTVEKGNKRNVVYYERIK